MGIEKAPESQPQANPAFGEGLRPTHVFLMRTTHIKGEATTEKREKYREQLKEAGAPDDVIERVLDRLLKEEGARATEGQVFEYHSMVLAEELDGTQHLYAIEAHEHQNGTFHADDSDRVELMTEEREGYTADKMGAFTISTTSSEYTKDWHGERSKNNHFEADTYAEMLDKLEVAGKKDTFLKLYPLAEKNASPIPKGTAIASPIPAKMTKAREQALVKRFGKAKVAELKKRIKEKQDHADTPKEA